MSLIYVTEVLLETIRLRSLLPANTPFTDSQLTRFANEEIQTMLVDSLIKMDEGHCLVEYSIPLVANTDYYRIPERAFANKIRDIYRIDNSGNKFRMTRLEPQNIPDYNNQESDSPHSFTIVGNHIRVLPDVSGNTTDSLGLVFYFKPGELVTASAYRVITAVNLSAKTITVDNFPATFALNSVYDVHGFMNGGEIKCWDLTPSNKTASLMIFNQAIDGSVFGSHPVEVGDYLVLKQTAAIPMLPAEMHPIIAQRVICRVLEAMKDEGLSMAQERLNEMNKVIGSTHDKRVTSKPKTIVFSPFTLGGSFYRRNVVSN